MSLLHETSDSQPASGVLAGELTPKEVQSVVDVRLFTRLKDVLDGLSTIGLLKPSLVLTDSSGQSGGLKEAQWAAETHTILEEPAECAELQALKHLWDGKHMLCPEPKHTYAYYSTALYLNIKCEVSIWANRSGQSGQLKDARC